MVTLGSERVLALRVTKGRLDRHGVFHERQPCIFLIWRGRRLG
jgi:hypothetical protein